MNGKRGKKGRTITKVKTVTSTRRVPRKGRRTFRRTRGTRVLGRAYTEVQRTTVVHPTRSLTKLFYNENSYITASGTNGKAVTGNSYRATSVYDPRYQNGGGQPQGFDQEALKYNRYRVHGCRVEVEFTNPSFDGMYVGVRVRDESDPITTVNLTIDELMPMKDSVMIAPLNNTGSQKKKFVFYIRPWDIFGLSKSVYNTDLNYSGLIGTNPNANIIIEPFAIHTVYDQNSTVRVNTNIKYYTEFSQRATLLDA